MKAIITEHIHVVLLAIGVALAAAGGARLGEEDFTAAVYSGRDQLVSQRTKTEPASKVVDPGVRLAMWAEEGAVLFSSGVLLIITGAILTRRRHGHRRRTLAGQQSSLNFPVELGRLAEEIASLRVILDKPDAVPADVRMRIEQLQYEILDPMFASRESLELEYGMTGFAAVIGPLASTERFINRTWTTLVDHHMGEARNSLAMAESSAQTARDASANLGVKTGK